MALWTRGGRSKQDRPTEDIDDIFGLPVSPAAAPDDDLNSDLYDAGPPVGSTPAPGDSYVDYSDGDGSDDQDEGIDPDDEMYLDFDDDDIAEIFGIDSADVAQQIQAIESGRPAQGPARAGRFDVSRLDEATGLAASQEREREQAQRLDVAKMSKEERKAYVKALGEELALHEHLVALKPRERYVFRSDYFEVDTSGSVACVLAFFHRDEATDEFAPFWGVERIPDTMPAGVRAVLVDSVSKMSDKWVDDAEKKSEKLAKLDEREQAAGGTMRSRRKMAKSADDLLMTIAELQDGAAYLSVHMRLILHADSLDKLDLAVERLGRQYIDRIPSVHVEPYHGEQRQELSTLMSHNDDRRGKGFHFTSTEFAGAYTLVTNGLTDPAGEYVGRMSGDYNNSAILFEVDRWEHHLVVADDTLNENLGRVRVSDMWASKISQAALLNNRKVVHLVLNGADLNKLGPAMSSITTKIDMSRGEINMFELFGERDKQTSLYDMHLSKLVLMAEQALEDPDTASIGIIRNELREVLNQFYIDRRMWARSPEENPEKLRLVGLRHDDVPRLMHFVPYLDSLHEQHLSNKNPDALSQHAVKVLQGVFKRLLQTNSELFNRQTSAALDDVGSSRRTIYDFSQLTFQSEGLAMAQLVNVIGFAISGLERGDTLILHGTDRIRSPQVREFLDRQFDRLTEDVGARIAFCYDKPDVMLAQREFNQLERADYTVLGPMVRETVDTYEQVMRSAIPGDLKNLLSMIGYAISYLRRGAANVVFSTELSLGMNRILSDDGELAGEEVAAQVAEQRRAKLLAQNNAVAELEQQQAAESAARHEQANRLPRGDISVAEDQRQRAEAERRERAQRDRQLEQDRRDKQRRQDERDRAEKQRRDRQDKLRREDEQRRRDEQQRQRDERERARRQEQDRARSRRG